MERDGVRGCEKRWGGKKEWGGGGKWGWSGGEV